MKAPEFPKQVSNGSCVVTIYRREHKGYDLFTLAYYMGGKRKMEQSADYLALRTRADEVLKDLNDGRTESTPMSAAQRDDHANALRILAPTGLPLHIVASHFAKAVEILGSDLVILAAQEYARRHQKIEPRSIGDAATEFLAEKTAQKKSDRHISTLTSHLTRFKDSVLMNIGSVLAPDIETFLSGLKVDKKPVSSRTRDNYVGSIVSLFEWAKSVKRYLPADYDEHTRISRLSADEDGVITTYTPNEFRAFLATADDKLKPFLTIGAFAGLRSSEIMRLNWEDVRTENGDPCVVVQKGKVKKRGQSRRIVPMPDNLKQWLLPHVKKTGKVWPFSVPYLYEMLRELAPKAEAELQKTDPKAKLEWLSNALRHSYISYRVATIKNIPQVALECGNSPQMINSNYRELVTEQAGKEWFGIAPNAK